MKASMIIFCYTQVTYFCSHARYNNCFIFYVSVYFDGDFKRFVWVIFYLRFSIDEFLLFLGAYFTHIRILSGALFKGSRPTYFNGSTDHEACDSMAEL